MPSKIICPVCKVRNSEGIGMPKILGEIDDQGNYVVVIGHNRGIKIVGNDFDSYCNQCGELVYFRKTVLVNQLVGTL